MGPICHVVVVVLVALAGTVHTAAPGAAERAALRRRGLQQFSPAPQTEPCDPATCQPQQRAALTQLYVAWGGPSWRNNSGWITAGIPHCSWFGVVCCADSNSTAAAAASSIALEQSPGYASDVPCTGGAVIGLSLPYNNVSGVLGDGISALSPLGPTMQLLDMDTNRLRGAVPQSFSALSRLRYLNLGSNNQLTGTLGADAFSTMAALTALLIPDSRLVGSVPTLGPYLKGIHHLDLGDNDVRGAWSHGRAHTQHARAAWRKQPLLSLCVCVCMCVCVWGGGTAPRMGWVQRRRRCAAPPPPLHAALAARQSSSRGKGMPPESTPCSPSAACSAAALELPPPHADRPAAACPPRQLNGTLPAWLLSSPSLRTVTLPHNRIAGPLPQIDAKPTEFAGAAAAAAPGAGRQ
jgi:hypothetical protein